jgi:hypothetical protein
MIERARVLVVIGILWCGSCGGPSSSGVQPRAPAGPPSNSVARTDPPAESAADAEMPSGVEPQNPQDPVARKRKIIFTAQLSFVVEDFSQAESQLFAEVTRFGGYVAEANVDRTSGTQRSGKWVVRVPATEFDSFVNAIVNIGVPETRHSNAQDVSEEFVDLEARIRSKREVERRVLRLLEDKAGNIKDVISVEGELGRVREDIERMEGRVRYLLDRTALATLTINAREQQTYVPPQAPVFTAQVAHTWGQSVQTLENFAKALTLIAVGLAPWTPIIAAVAACGVWIVARVRRGLVVRLR